MFNASPASLQTFIDTPNCNSFINTNLIHNFSLQTFIDTPNCNSFFNTNLIHNFYNLHKIKFLYIFRASSAYPQEVSDVNYVCMQPLVSHFSAGGCLAQSLKEVFLQRLHKTATCRERRYQWLHTYTIYIIDLLRMSE
jgi:hypothetical protein